MNPAHAIDDKAGLAGARSHAGRALPRGTRLREYELADVVGEAGFAIVYRAWDTILQRRVAVKEYLPVSMASPRRRIGRGDAWPRSATATPTRPD